MLDVAHAIDHSITAVDLAMASTGLLRSAEQVIYASREFSDADLDRLSEGLLRYIHHPDERDCGVISFDDEGSRSRSPVELVAFARLMSADLLQQATAPQILVGPAGQFSAEPTLRELTLQHALALFFRYAYCIHTQEAVLPVSEILKFIEAATLGLPAHQRDDQSAKVLTATLTALSRCE